MVEAQLYKKAGGTMNSIVKVSLILLSLFLLLGCNPNESEEEYYVTDYAIHTKLRIAQEYLEKNPNGRVLLMLDELNRCEKPVMSELMNLILNREINGFQNNIYLDVSRIMLAFFYFEANAFNLFLFFDCIFHFLRHTVKLLFYVSFEYFLICHRLPFARPI